MIRLRKQNNLDITPMLEFDVPNIMAKALDGGDRPDEIISDFQDPYLELVRLLRESAEIEHALMVQYLYAAFSIRDVYSGIVGPPIEHGDGLMPVAIQEMEHLHEVTRLLMALGATPNLVSQSFPYDADIYPFTLNLERLTLQSLAKYVFTEAAAESITPQPGDDDPFLELLFAELGSVRPNHLGSVYSRIIQLTERVQADPPFELPDLTQHIVELRHIKEQGEDAHFRFFKSVFLGEHPGFNGNSQVWQLPPNDPAYPSLPVQANPSAYEGHPHAIHNAETRAIAMLGNLHYWIILMLLDLSYRNARPQYLGLAISNHMTGPLMTLGQLLAQRGVGLPFDPSNLSSSTGNDEATNLRFVKRLVLEAQGLTNNLRAAIGNDEADGQIFTLQDTFDSLGN